MSNTISNASIQSCKPTHLVFFDIDDVLVNRAAMQEAAFREIWKNFIQPQSGTAFPENFIKERYQYIYPLTTADDTIIESILEDLCEISKIQDFNIEELKKEYKAIYNRISQNCTVVTGLFSGAIDTLKALKNNGAEIILVTSRILPFEATDPADIFCKSGSEEDLQALVNPNLILCNIYGSKSKPKVSIALGALTLEDSILERLIDLGLSDIPRTNWVMIGDQTGDRDFALGMGMPFIQATYAYNNPAMNPRLNKILFCHKGLAFSTADKVSSIPEAVHNIFDQKLCAAPSTRPFNSL